MKLLDTYQGGDDGFEGDHSVTLRSLPAGARIRRAIITLAPAQPVAGNQVQFEEVLVFGGSADEWGVTRNASGGFVEVDFHARRTLAKVKGPNLEGTNLQVDLGGTYVEINDRGAILAPNDTRFALRGDESLPGLMVNKFKLSKLEGTAPQIASVTIRSVPTNLSVRLGQMPTFWLRLGELTIADSSPDFAAVLTAFLVTAPIEQGFYVLPFVIHSDTIARLDVTVEIDYFMEQAVLPAYLPEVTLPFNFSTQPGIPSDLLTLSLPRGALPIAGLTGAQIRGEFQPTRIADGPIGQEPESFVVVVSPACSLAQPLQAAKEIELIGIDLPLANTAPGLAGMNVSIQSDADGKPSGITLVTADVRVEKPLPGQSSWGSAILATPVRLQPNVHYWIILQSRIGEAYWRAVQSAATMRDGSAVRVLQCSRDDGLSWRVAATQNVVGPLSALFRLRHTPERFTVPVRLQIGHEPTATYKLLNDFAPLGRVEFSFDFADKLGEHLVNPALGSACGAGELLHNGGFDLPPHTDATRLLFGFDAGRSINIQGQVDLRHGINLSTKRYLWLSLAGGPPVRIDCAGANPGRTTPDEIVAAINRTVGTAIASIVTLQTDAQPQLVLQLARSDSEYEEVTLRPWRDDRVPEGWEQPPESGGTMTQFKRPRLFVHSRAKAEAQAEQIVAALETTQPGPVILAQRVPVHAGCTYALRLRYESYRSMLAFETKFDLAGDRSGQQHLPASITPRWQIRWLDVRGQIVAQEQADFGIIRDSQGNQTNEGLVEERLVAPDPASQAEIRLIQPNAGLLLIDDVSFAPVLDAVINGDFSRWTQTANQDPGLPVGWASPTGLVDQGGAENENSPRVELSGAALDDTVLEQVVQIDGGAQFQLRVRARHTPAATDDRAARSAEERARLELRWLADAPLGLPLLLPLDGRDFPSHAWDGTAPATALQAELRLIQPPDGGLLSVELVSLARVEQVEVPLIFLSEAPGDLTVAQLRVAYDLPAPPVEQRRVAPSLTQTRLAARRLRGDLPRRSPLADRAIEDISGVSTELAQRLRQAQPAITTIGELAAVDLGLTMPGIPGDRLQELKTRAEIIVLVQVAVESFSSIADMSLEQVVALPPAELASRAGRSTAKAEQVQHSLRVLRLMLKKDAFNSLHVSNLQAGSA